MHLITSKEIFEIYCLIFYFSFIKCNNIININNNRTNVTNYLNTSNVDSIDNSNHNDSLVIRKRHNADQIAVPVVYSIENRHLWRKPQPFETPITTNYPINNHPLVYAKQEKILQPPIAFTYHHKHDQKPAPTIQYYGTKGYYEDLKRNQTLSNEDNEDSATDNIQKTEDVSEDETEEQKPTEPVDYSEDYVEEREEPTPPTVVKQDEPQQGEEEEEEEGEEEIEEAAEEPQQNRSKVVESESEDEVVEEAEEEQEDEEEQEEPQQSVDTTTISSEGDNLEQVTNASKIIDGHRFEIYKKSNTPVNQSNVSDSARKLESRRNEPFKYDDPELYRKYYEDPIVYDEDKHKYRRLSDVIGRDQYENSLKTSKNEHKNLYEQSHQNYNRPITIDRITDDDYHHSKESRPRKKLRRPKYRLIRVYDYDDDEEEDSDFRIDPVLKQNEDDSREVYNRSYKDASSEAEPSKLDKDESLEAYKSDDEVITEKYKPEINTERIINKKKIVKSKVHPKFRPLFDNDNTDSSSEPVYNVREYPEYYSPIFYSSTTEKLVPTTAPNVISLLKIIKPEELNEQPAESRTNIHLEELFHDSRPQASGHHHKTHKKPKKKDTKFKKGGGKKHESEHHSKHGEKGDKGYKGYHKHEKGQKGHHDKEAHKGSYTDHSGHKKKHHHEDGHFAGHKKEEKGEKGAKYGEHGKHEKGHSTKGEHNIHKKDEYEKKHEFFDEYHEGGESEKHGGFHAEHEGHKGGSYKGGHHKSGHDQGKHGKKGKKEKGGHYHDNKGHKNAAGHDEHYKHESKYGKKEGHEEGKKWGYKKGKQR